MKQQRNVFLNYKSGKTTLLKTEMTINELKEKIKNNVVDINSDDFTMIRWSEVESIVNKID